MQIWMCNPGAAMKKWILTRVSSEKVKSGCKLLRQKFRIIHIFCSRKMRKIFCGANFRFHLLREKMHKFHWKKTEHFKKIILQQNFLHRTFTKVMKEKLFNMILLNFSYSDLRAENYTRCFLQLIVAATTLMVFSDIFFREIIFS